MNDLLKTKAQLIEELESARMRLRELEAQASQTSGLTAGGEVSMTGLRAMFDSSRDAIGVSKAGVHVLVNPSYQRMFGYASETDLIGSSILCCIAPSEHETILAKVKARMQGESPPSEYQTRGRRRDGTEFDMEVWLSTYVLESEVHTMVILRDLTERRLAEQELRRYAHIVSSTTDLLAFLDINFVYLAANPAYLESFGMSREELIGNNVIDLLGEQYFEEVIKEPAARCFAGEQPEYQAWVDLPHGGRRQMNVNFYPSRGGDGEVNGFVVNARDITEREMTARALEESERSLSAAQRIAQIGSWSQDKESGALSWSDELFRIMGIEHQEVTLELFMSCIHPDDRAEVVAAIELGESGEPSVAVKFRIIRPDGSVRHLLNRRESEGNADGEELRTFGTAQDITEQELVREELESSKALLAETGRLAKVGGWELDRETLELRWTDETYRIHELPVGETPSLEDAENFYHPDDIGKLEAVVQRALELGEPYDCEFRLITAKGNQLWTQSICNPVTVDGETVKLVGAFQDITKRRALEAEKLQLETHLRRAQKLETIGTLAGGIAHDFNNILTPIMGFAEIAASRTHPSDPLYSDLERILEGAQRASDLVKRILLFSRQTEKDRNPLRIQSITHEAMQLLRSSIPATISIDVQIDSSCDPVLADETQIHEVIVNICTNAYHAMEGGTGRLTVRVEQLDLDAEAIRLHPDLREATYVRISIQDTGAGMDPETIDRIFEPFFTTKAVDKGSGMGLSVVHGIIQSHGGGIVVHSTPGEGTLFEVYLPVTSAEAGFQTRESNEIEKGQESILVLDDDPGVARVVTSMVKLLGYEVTTYTSSPAALEELIGHPQRYDLVISDLTMPELTGIDLFVQLRQLAIPTPLLIMTGYGDELEQTIEDPPKIIAKPVSMKVLAGIIREMLDD